MTNIQDNIGGWKKQPVEDEEQPTSAHRPHQNRMNNLFEHLAEYAKELIFVCDNGYFSYVNESAVKTFGHGREYLLSHPCSEFLGSRTCAMLEEILRKPEDIQRSGSFHDLSFLTAAGQTRHLSCRITVLHSDRAPRVIVHGIDITDQKAVKQALRDSEERYRTLTDSAPDIIYTLDLDGRFTYVNPQWRAILGHSSEEVIGKAFHDFAVQDDLPELIRIFQRVYDLKEAFEPANARLLDREGNERWFELSGAPYRNGKNDVMGLVGIAKDVTGRMKAEEQLRQAQKMDAIKRLAGGVAHDFNNILQSIQSNTQLMILDQKKEGRSNKRLKQIEKSTRRASELTRQLLAFSQMTENRFHPLNINEVIENSKDLLLSMLPHTIQLDLQLSDEIPAVLADPSRMEEALLNLAVNGRDAMPEGGNLQIMSRLIILDGDYCRTQPDANPGPHVVISVSDSGHGMDRDVIDHIFEPFYTTREIGAGSGLGLATVYGIVKSHAGHIACSSELGRGTTFKIYLPTINEEVWEIEEEQKVNPEPVEQQATILLVDDEEALREVGTEILEAYGYHVLTAVSGEDALEIYESRRTSVDLVILDLLMPGMGGQKCLQKILALNPGQKVIIASGYAATGQAQEVLDQGAMGFLSKPYDLERMIQLITSVLNAPATAGDD
jgi:PAS domain S-box-containing protein